MRRVACITLALIALAIAVCAAQAGPGPFHVDALNGSVAKVGFYTSGGARYPLYAVELDARVCFRSLAEAQRTFPSEVRITHFAISRPTRRWGVLRTVIERPLWLVPFGETWQGACGVSHFQDLIPSEYLGAEALGNPVGCYGVELMIRVGARRSTKRITVKCGAIGR
jgi:hypothetical protein